MLRIHCPFCGERDHSEFSYGGDGTVALPALDAPQEQWHEAIFMRDNIRGRQIETWHHANGCRLWLLVERDTVTHEIFSVKAANPSLEALAKENFVSQVDSTSQSSEIISDGQLEVADKNIIDTNDTSDTNVGDTKE